MEPKEFMHLARFFALANGKYAHKLKDDITWFFYAKNNAGLAKLNRYYTKVYTDEHIVIVADEDNSALLVLKKIDNNPVVVVISNGKLLRFHSEASALYEHLQKLTLKFLERKLSGSNN